MNFTEERIQRLTELLLWTKGEVAMGWIQIVSLIMSALPAMIQMVEMIINLTKGAGAGALKKEVVVGIVQTILDGIASAPGNSALKAQEPIILGIVGDAIDLIVAVFNKNGVFQTSA